MVEIANRIPITVKMNAVVVIVLTIWNFTAAIRFGRPFGQGHTVDGLICLCSGTVLNITISAYQAYYRREADQKVSLFSTRREFTLIVPELEVIKGRNSPRSRLEAPWKLGDESNFLALSSMNNNKVLLSQSFIVHSRARS